MWRSFGRRYLPAPPGCSALFSALALMLLAASVAVPASAARKPSPNEERIRSEFVGKSFQTNIFLGNSAVLPARNGQPCARLVDTEYRAGGGIAYLTLRTVCPDSYLPEGNIRLGAQQLQSGFGVGTKVWVAKIEFMDDRVEFILNTADASPKINTGNYAKIKLMVGPAYREWSYDQFVDVLSGAIAIPSRQRARELAAEYDKVKADLQKAESRYRSAEADSAAKISAAGPYRVQLQRALKNRTEFSATGRPAPEAAEHQRQMDALNADLVRMQQQAAGEKLRQAHAELEAAPPQLAVPPANLAARAASFADLDSRRAAVWNYRLALAARSLAYDALVAGGEAVPPGDGDKFKVQIAEAARFCEDVERDRPLLQIAKLNQEFAALERRRVPLATASAQAPAAQKKAKVEALRSHLQQMLSNRNDAQQLGVGLATGQAAKLQKDIAALR